MKRVTPFQYSFVTFAVDFAVSPLVSPDGPILLPITLTTKSSHNAYDARIEEDGSMFDRTDAIRLSLSTLLLLLLMRGEEKVMGSESDNCWV